jgi:hypothetical protein
MDCCAHTSIFGSLAYVAIFIACEVAADQAIAIIATINAATCFAKEGIAMSAIAATCSPVVRARCRVLSLRLREAEATSLMEREWVWEFAVSVSSMVRTTTGMQAALKQIDPMLRHCERRALQRRQRPPQRKPDQ